MITEIDWIPLWGTFIACLLLGIEIGILVGVVIDVILLLYYNARPRITVQKISVKLTSVMCYKSRICMYCWLLLGK